MVELRQVSVVGEGSVAVTADCCIVRLGLNVMAGTAADAYSGLVRRSAQVVDWVKSAGLQDADIRTTSLNIHDWIDKATRTVTARVASYQLELTVEPLAALSDLLKGLVTIAGDSLQLHGVQLAIGDPHALRQEARVLAMEDARARAQQFAEAGGAVLGDVVSIEEANNDGGMPFQGFARAAWSAGPPQPALPIETGNLAVSCRVAVAYELRS